MFRFISPYLIIIIIFSLVVFAFWICYKTKLRKIFKLLLSICLITSSALISNAFWLERFVIQKNLHVLQRSSINKKIAIVADIHVGVWKGKTFVQSIAYNINSIEGLDLVLIAGDWTYYPDKYTLGDTFSPLKSVKAPIYGVLGNHDVEFPGDPVRKELSIALKENNVTLIDNIVVPVDGVNLVGLGDHWAGEDDTKILEFLNLSLPSIIIAHNPDSTLNYSRSFKEKVKNQSAEVLTVSGHTHCGQVRIPLIYNNILPVKNSYYDKGWYQGNSESDFFKPVDQDKINPKGNNLFISCGVGEVGLPLRLFNPATIDIIEWRQ
jgi:uncharacterized protein